MNANERKAVLVYQAGIANVFRVYSDGKRIRIMQSDFRSCEQFARGLAYAGFKVDSMHCNRAGDIERAEWSADLDSAPFSDKFQPVGT